MPRAPTDWLGWNGNVYNQRYSSLTDINVANVKRLKQAWARNLTLPGLKAKVGALGVFAEQQPIVYKGTMYMPDSSGNVWAMDATSGERIWVHRAKFPKGLTPLLPSRGVAMGDGKVYIGLGDASMSALDQSTGRQVWKNTVADWKDGYYFTNAPTYYKNMIITGISGGDSGARAFVIALNAKTGKELWRFNVIPAKKGDPGYWTWPNKKAFLGGGAMWNTPTVDPALGLAYVAVGNPIPYSGVIRGAGAELFTDSIIALNLKNGKLRWYFQTTHHDIWDYDATNPTVLFDLNGKKAIAQAGKTGWVYILNRSNGKPLYGIPEKKVEQLKSVNTYATQPIPNGDSSRRQCATKPRVCRQEGAGRQAVPEGRVHLHAVRRQGVRRLRPRGARRRELAAVGVQPEDRLHVHLLEGLRVRVAGGSRRGPEAAGARRLLADRGPHPRRGRHRAVEGPDRRDEHAQQPARLVEEVGDDLLQRDDRDGREPHLHRHERGVPPGVQREDRQPGLAVAAAEGRRQRAGRHLQGERQAVRGRLRGRQRDRVDLRRLEAELQLEVLRLRYPVVSTLEKRPGAASPPRDTNRSVVSSEEGSE